MRIEEKCSQSWYLPSSVSTHSTDRGEGGRDIRDINSADSRIPRALVVITLLVVPVLRPPLVAPQTAALAIVPGGGGGGGERGCGWGRGCASSPFDDVYEARLDDFDVASGEVGKSGEFEVAAVRSWL